MAVNYFQSSLYLLYCKGVISIPSLKADSCKAAQDRRSEILPLT
jgi:hypothetical protein